MTTFTTTITAMYTLQQPDPNYVVNALWEVTGVDGTNTASIGGNTQFNSADQEGAFIPYASLTEATVIGWIPEQNISNAQAKTTSYPSCVALEIKDINVNFSFLS